MDTLAGTPVVPLAANFLVPNATFIAEVIAFVIIIWVLAKYVVPPINKAMEDRQAAIRKQFAELDEAKADARKAEAEYKEQLNNAKHEAARIREEAREQGAQIVQEAREKAGTEADRIIEHAHAQIEADRKAAFASLPRRWPRSPSGWTVPSAPRRPRPRSVTSCSRSASWSVASPACAGSPPTRRCHPRPSRAWSSRCSPGASVTRPSTC
jgi:F-type H+-transporting ATPase subunit b